MFHAIFLIKIYYALVTCYITIKYIYIFCLKKPVKNKMKIKNFFNA